MFKEFAESFVADLVFPLGDTALHLVCSQPKYVDIMLCLVKNPYINFDRTDSYGMNCVHVCCTYDNYQALQLIPKLDVKLKEINGLTPVDLAIYKGSTQCLLILLPCVIQIPDLIGPTFTAAI